MDTKNLTRGYIQSWNFTLEHRIGDWIATAGYVATRSVNQLAGLDQNWGGIGEGNAGRQLNKQFGRTATTQLFGSLGTAKYDSLQTQISLHRLFYVGMIVGGDAGSGWVGATIEVRGLSGRIS